MRPDKLPNVHKTATGYVAVASIARGHRRNKRFKATATSAEITAWIEAARSELRAEQRARELHAAAEAGRPVTRAAMAEIVASLRSAADKIEAVIHAS